jgi:hypothetical protein
MLWVSVFLKSCAVLLSLIFCEVPTLLGLGYLAIRPPAVLQRARSREFAEHDFCGAQKIRSSCAGQLKNVEMLGVDEYEDGRDGQFASSARRRDPTTHRTERVLTMVSYGSAR